jgi:hypothetical protein
MSCSDLRTQTVEDECESRAPHAAGAPLVIEGLQILSGTDVAAVCCTIFTA